MKKNKSLARFAPPPLPQVYKMAAPIQMPVKKSGIIGRFVTRMEMKFDEEYYASAARINESQHRAVKAFNDTMLEATTFGLRFKDTVEEYEHKSVMRQLDREEKELKMRVIYFEAMNGDIEYQIKKSRLERRATETEDREN